MSQATVLITGANRGLGLEFVKQYAEAGWQVIACCRWPDEAKELQAQAERSGDRIEIHQLDVADFEEVDALALILQGRAIDLLINNAGTYPQSDFGNVNYEAWAEAFHINSMAPMKMAEAFVGHVASSNLKKIVAVSSKMGSLDDNTSGGSYIYRSTKTAVNMVMKSLAIDLKPKGIASTILHPGWVRTDMGGPNGLIDAPESVAGMRRVIDELTLESSGRFVAYDGKEIPW
jgi:NAD(P)-dependent dehydrogenase (short-subunit alcohol dehydrogenase family)